MNSEKAWSGQLVIDTGTVCVPMEKDKNWFFVADSGATEPDYYYGRSKEVSYPVDASARDALPDANLVRGTNNQYYYQDPFTLPAQCTVFERLNSEGLKADYVTVTMGGNDMGFAEVVGEAAFKYRYNPEKLTEDLRDRWDNIFDEHINPETKVKEEGLEQKLKKMYLDIHERAGDQAHIIIVGYPTLMNENAGDVSNIIEEMKKICDSSSYTDVFLRKNAIVVDYNARMFNDCIRDIVEECNQEKGEFFHFVSVEEGFAGHEAYTSEPYLNGVMTIQEQDINQLSGSVIGLSADSNNLKNILQFDAPISSYSMHPNEKGIEVYRKAVQDKIDELEAKRRGESIEESSEESLEESSEAPEIIEPQPSVFPLTQEAAKMYANYISAGYSVTAGLRADGTATATSYSESMVSKWTDIVSVAAGNSNTFGLKKDGTIATEGWNGFNQRDVSEWKNIVAIAEGLQETAGLQADGTVLLRGMDHRRTSMISGWTDIAAISAGAWYTIGLKADGTVVADGLSPSSQTISAWTDISAVSAGYNHAVGLKRDGSVVTAGRNIFGECDISGWTGIVSVSAGGGHTVGLKADGTVIATGDNSFGQCDVSDWSDIVAVSAGGIIDHDTAYGFTVGLKADGTVVATGYNGSGQCDVSEWTNIGPTLQTNADTTDPQQSIQGSESDTVTIPKLIGLTYNAAREQYGDILDIRIVEQSDSPFAQNIIIEQYGYPGVSVNKGMKVDVKISTGHLPDQGITILFPIPDGFSSFYQIQFSEPVSNQEICIGGSVDTTIQPYFVNFPGTGIHEITFNLMGSNHNTKVSIGTYRIDYDAGTFTVPDEDMTAAFQSVSGLT